MIVHSTPSFPKNHRTEVFILVDIVYFNWDLGMRLMVDNVWGTPGLIYLLMFWKSAVPNSPMLKPQILRLWALLLGHEKFHDSGP